MPGIPASFGRSSELLPAARARGGWRTGVGAAGCLGGFLPFAWTCREVLGPGPSGMSKLNCSARVSPREADISLRGGGKEVEGLWQRSSTSKDPRYHPLSTYLTPSIEGAGGSVLFPYGPVVGSIWDTGRLFAPSVSYCFSKPGTLPRIVSLLPVRGKARTWACWLALGLCCLPNKT